MRKRKTDKTQLHVRVSDLFRLELEALTVRWRCTSSEAVRRAVQEAAERTAEVGA